ncbi:MAG: hypothetical protein KBC44_01690 [Candidatus Pacebacteria bacterium]|nr:hypothetical protein [Candidatus Paceibacterota bacterium]
MKTTLKYILVIVVLGIVIFFNVSKKDVEAPKIEEDNTDLKEEVLPNVMNISYMIDGEEFVLVNGRAQKTVEVELDGFTMTNSLMIIEEPVYTDVDKDGDTDGAVWLVNDSGGTGSFFYGALIINNNNESASSTDGMFLGDRISPKSISFKEGRIVYSFLERGMDEPMSAEPTHKRDVWVHYDKDSNTIGEWVKDFEGESR